MVIHDLAWNIFTLEIIDQATSSKIVKWIFSFKISYVSLEVSYILSFPYLKLILLK